jgi:hypothetical protein
VSANTNLSYTGTLTGSTGIVNIGSGQVYKDASGNVGIGTSSPAQKLQNSSTANVHIYTSTGNTGAGGYGGGYKFLSYDYTNSGALDAEIGYYYGGASIKAYMSFSTKGDSTQALTERARIDSSGNLLVGTTSKSDVEKFSLSVSGDVGMLTRPTSNITYYAHIFRNSSNSTVGSIICSGSSTSFNTSSDYRLKEDVQPMAGALEKVQALKPVTYKWKSTGESSEGFIAHELQAVCPSAVSGEKDALNEDGSIKPQGIDTSFLVATLTAAIQELKAIVDEQASRITALEGAAA